MKVLVFGHTAIEMVDALRPDYPEHVWTAAAEGPEVLSLAADCEVLMGMAPRIKPELVRAMPKLRWIHALTTGVDNLLLMPDLQADVALTNTHGIHAPQMSELALMLMLAMPRQLPRVIANQQRAVWDQFEQPLLSGKTLCIVGVGSISELLARRCGALDMIVTGVSDGRSAVPGFTRLYPRSALPEALEQADFVVVLAPYTPETHHLIGEVALTAMKPSAYLINLARGGCVDEAALLRHLRSGSIAGAGLDVFKTEPLPADSPLWSEPGILVVPHLGGRSDIYGQQALPIIRRNLDAVREGGIAVLPHRILHHE